MLPWDDFRIVLAIARARTLSGAARSLKVDQSTVSRRLAALERAVDARLFERSASGYALTAAGLAVLPALQQIESDSIAVEQTLLGRDARLEGRVRLALSDSFATWFLVPRLQALRAEHPGITLELLTGNAPVDLTRQEADLSLRMSKPTQPSLIGKRVGRGGWALYASEDYVRRRGRPEPRRRLAGHDVIGFHDDLAATLGARWLREHATRAQVALRSNSMIAHAAAVVAGLGTSPLPCLFGDVHEGLLRISAAPIGHHEIWLVVHPHVKDSARVRAVMTSLTALLARESGLLAGIRS